MTRVLVVQRDPFVGERMIAELRAAGYETETCGGPGSEPCPVQADLPCALVDRADVLVYDAWVAGGSAAGHDLVWGLRELYADLPVVLTSADPSVAWVERDGPHRVVPLPPGATSDAFLAAVQLALADQGMAV